MSEQEKEILKNGTEEEITHQEQAVEDEKTNSAETVDINSEAEIECDETDELDDTCPDNQKEGGSLFKKKKKPDKKQDALKEKIEELEDKVKRQMAEFDNFRKRTDKEKTTMFEMGAKSVIEKILPVIDNFERGLSVVPEEEKGTAFAEGMNLVYKQLMAEMEGIGIKPIEAVGQEFNPDFHNAVMQVESEEFEEGIVAQELQKGYMYRETVVRHSMVAVAQ